MQKLHNLLYNFQIYIKIITGLCCSCFNVTILLALLCFAELLAFASNRIMPQALALVVLFVVLVDVAEKKVIKLKIEHILLGVFLFINFISIVQSIYIEDYAPVLRNIWQNDKYWRSILQFFMLFVTCLPFFYFTLLSMPNKTKIMLLKFYNIAVFLSVLYGLYCWIGYLYGFPYVSAGIHFAEMLDFFPRIKSIMIEPSFFAHYAATGFFVSIGLFLYKGKKWYLLQAILVLIVIALTMSRGCWVALFLSFSFLLITVFVFKKKLHIKYVKFIFRLAGICVFFFLFSLFMFDFFFSDHAVLKFLQKQKEKRSRLIYLNEDLSFGTRHREWDAAISMLKEHPFLGVGVGNVWFHTRHHSRYIEWISEIMSDNYANIANLFLHIFASNGIIGGIIFVFFILVVLWKSLLKMRTELDSSRLGLLLGVFFAVICSLIQYMFFYANLVYFWILLGMLSYLSNENDL